MDDFRADRAIAGETRSPARVAGEGPRATVRQRLSLFTVGRGPVPRHAASGTRNGLDRWTIFAQIERSRGTGPRATVDEAAARSGEPELQFSARNLANLENLDNPAHLLLILRIL